MFTEKNLAPGIHLHRSLNNKLSIFIAALSTTHMAMMVHLYNSNLLAPRLLALDSYKYQFHGKAAHAFAALDGIFGSSDAGNVSMVCPTFHPTLQIVEPDVAIHTRAFEEGVNTERASEMEQGCWLCKRSRYSATRSCSLG